VVPACQRGRAVEGVDHAVNKRQHYCHQQGGQLFATDERIAGGCRRQTIGNQRQRQVSRAGVVLTVEDRWIQRAAPGCVGYGNPDALDVRNAIVVANVDNRERHPAADYGGGRQPQHRRRQRRETLGSLLRGDGARRSQGRDCTAADGPRHAVDILGPGCSRRFAAC